MGFNDDIFQLTGGKGYKNVKRDNDLEEDLGPVENEEKLIADQAGSDESGNTTEKWASEYGNPDYDYVIESDLKVPVVGAVKDINEKPLIVVVDDDFETLDLIEIYLKRDYTYEGFSGPKEAIFFLNQHVPEIVFIDCKIHTMKAMTFIDIVRSGKGNEKVPFVLLGTEEELREFDPVLMPESVVGRVKKPVARGILQEYIDGAVKKE